MLFKRLRFSALTVSLMTLVFLVSPTVAQASVPRSTASGAVHLVAVTTSKSPTRSVTPLTTWKTWGIYPTIDECIQAGEALRKAGIAVQYECKKTSQSGPVTLRYVPCPGCCPGAKPDVVKPDC